MTKFFKKMQFWTKVKYTITMLGTGGEVTLVLNDAPHFWMWVTGGATLIGALISLWFEDKNNNGIVDAFED